MKIYTYDNEDVLQKDSLIEALDIDIKTKNIITVVGAGGKTSTIFNLAKEISKLNRRVIVTTTTHMSLDKDFFIINNEDILRDENIYLKRIKSILDNKDIVKVGALSKNNKVKSVKRDFLEKLIEICDVMLIEGDGSKRLPLKVPNDNEPVIIESTNIVIGVVGIDSVGKRIKDICHRPDDVSRFLSKKIDDYVDYNDLTKIITSEFALRKNVDCNYKVIINKVDDKSKLDDYKYIDKILKDSNIKAIFTSYI